MPDDGFLKYGRKEPGYRPKEERVRDFKAVELRLSDDEIRDQARRCMDCGTPFCHGCGCPLSNVAPELNDLVVQQRWADALKLLVSTNPFPEFTGRICPALCEGSCVLGINDKPVSIRQIELAIIEKAFELGLIAPDREIPRRNRRVAVVGSGPAGLGAAEFLNKAGFNVVVYENDRKPGGVLRYGIPEFKLEKWVIDRRIRLMTEEGVGFETGVSVGSDLSYRFLSGHFDAVLLAGGAREARDLKVPGRENSGIHFAMDFLIQQNRLLDGEAIPAAELINAGGKDVVVIGGGDTGADCLGTSIRQGARKVYQFEIMPKPPVERDESTPWPMWPNMLRESSSHKEGGDRRWCISTKEFLGSEGKLSGIKCVEVEWVSGTSGRMEPREKPGTEFTVEVQLALLAMGFVGPGKNPVAEALKLERDARGMITRDANCMTSQPGVFVAGDMTQGASLVVRAINDGVQAARGMIRWFKK
ncbi:MAG: glutamate synthase [Verrucomicrobia bacterium]|nr:glutamate synthase [Verrucomicrobiota bacterium]